jgi:hypothetical protein
VGGISAAEGQDNERSLSLQGHTDAECLGDLHRVHGLRPCKATPAQAIVAEVGFVFVCVSHSHLCARERQRILERAQRRDGDGTVDRAVQHRFADVGDVCGAAATGDKLQGCAAACSACQGLEAHCRHHKGPARGSAKSASCKVDLSKRIVGYVADGHGERAAGFEFPYGVAVAIDDLQPRGVKVQVHLRAVDGLGTGDGADIHRKDLVLEDAR